MLPIRYVLSKRANAIRRMLKEFLIVFPLWRRNEKRKEMWVATSGFKLHIIVPMLYYVISGERTITFKIGRFVVFQKQMLLNSIKKSSCHMLFMDAFSVKHYIYKEFILVSESLFSTLWQHAVKWQHVKHLQSQTTVDMVWWFWKLFDSRLVTLKVVGTI